MTTNANAFHTLIRHEMAQQGGVLSFAAFMALALYHPEWGYYHSERFDIGKYGDFTTASEISPLFAHCFAMPCCQIMDHLHTGNILELGAGTGRFAGELLHRLAQLGALPTHYYIYEISPRLRQKQQALLKSHYPSRVDRVIWLEALPDHFTGVIIANEVLDALPVHCFRVNDQHIAERCVTWEQEQFTWTLREPLSPELAREAENLHEHYQFDNGYESEINLHLAPFIHALTQTLDQGVILISDYGYGQSMYYHPERRHGTLTCFHQHRRHDDPLILPGTQDITAHVDFTRVIETAAHHGCTLGGYTTQAAFLLDCGLIHLAEQHAQNMSETDKVNLHQAIKLLTMPTEMGERVKMMALNKETALPLRGFHRQDNRREL